MTTLNLALAAATAALAFLRCQDRSGKPDPDHQPEANTFGLPTGAPIESRLKEFFRGQLSEVLAALPATGLPRDLPDLASWDRPMAEGLAPLLAPYWLESREATLAEIAAARPRPGDEGGREGGMGHDRPESPGDDPPPVA